MNDHNVVKKRVIGTEGNARELHEFLGSMEVFSKNIFKCKSIADFKKLEGDFSRYKDNSRLSIEYAYLLDSVWSNIVRTSWSTLSEELSPAEISSAEMFLQSAQIMVDHEKRIELLEQAQKNRSGKSKELEPKKAVSSPEMITFEEMRENFHTNADQMNDVLEELDLQTAISPGIWRPTILGKKFCIEHKRKKGKVQYKWNYSAIKQMMEDEGWYL